MLNTDPSPDIESPSPWQRCLQKLLEKIGPASYETWFRTTDFQVVDDTAQILVPSQFFADFMEEHFTEIVRDVLFEAGIGFSKLSFVPTQKDWKILEPICEEIVQSRTRVSAPSTGEPRQRFHPSYIFDRFVVGDGNRMAHAAAMAVAEAPGRTTFNPLVVYGGTGLGKTHLLQAVGHFAQTEGTAEHALYMTSEEFSAQYIDHLFNRKDSSSFHKRFAKVDLLLIDDIQFLSGKEGTQKEFFRIFNKMLLDRKQIILSSDRPPDKIPDMMAHIISRFMGGLITDIQPPNLETRMAIIRAKAETDGISLPNEVVEFIASHITSNVRELEGTLIKLIASSSFTGRDITLPVARELCGDVISRKNQRVSIRLIQSKVADAFGISPNQMAAHSRKRDFSFPRSIAMHLCKKLTNQSLRTIGLDFGGRDYSTVIYSCKKIDGELEKNPELRERIAAIEKQIGAA